VEAPSEESVVAINKAKTSPWMKAFIIFLIVAFVVTIGAASIPSIFQLFTQPTGTQTTTQATPAATVEQVAAQFQPGITALTAAAASDPTSYTAQVNLGNAYFDWAQTLSTPAAGASQISTAAMVAVGPLWLSSKEAYAKAVKIKPGEPGVETDMAIVTFYSGETTAAIVIAERVTKAKPDFSQAWLNLGVFYANSGQDAKAIAAFERYVKLDPKGQNVSFAQDQIKQLKTTPTAP
jgi:predicted Zn-dependent protease